MWHWDWQYMFIQSENAALDLDDPPFTFSFLWNIYLLAEMICSRSFNWRPSKAPHHNQCGLKRLMNNFCKTCEDFNLTISIHKQMLRDKISHFHIISQSMACNRQLKKKSNIWALWSQITFHYILRAMPVLARMLLFCQSWQREFGKTRT